MRYNGQPISANAVKLGGGYRKPSSEPLFQLFNDLVYCWADRDIIQCHMQYLVHPGPVGMRIFPAGNGPVIINSAIIIRTKKRAWHRFENIVTIFVNPKIIGYKLRWLNFQRFSHSLYIPVSDTRAQRPAAIGTSEAIDLRKHFFMQAVKRLIKFPGILFG